MSVGLCHVHRGPPESCSLVNLVSKREAALREQGGLTNGEHSMYNLAECLLYLGLAILHFTQWWKCGI
jgi:hypothetical protein